MRAHEPLHGAWVHSAACPPVRSPLTPLAMAQRTVEIGANVWDVSPTGRVTQYSRDEFGILFRRRGGTPAEDRVVRYAPLGARIPEDSLTELSEFQLRELWSRSQPAWTAPETGYRR